MDAAPLFSDVLQSFQKFLVKHGLIDELTGERLVRFCWCSDGPFDVRDFVVKQCFISKVSYRRAALSPSHPFQPLSPKVKMPTWMQGDVVDVRTAVLDWLHAQEPVNHVAAARVRVLMYYKPFKRSSSTDMDWPQASHAQHFSPAQGSRTGRFRGQTA